MNGRNRSEEQMKISDSINHNVNETTRALPHTATRRLLSLSLAGFILFSGAVGLRAESKDQYEMRIVENLTRVLDGYLGVGHAQVMAFVDADPLYMVPPLKEDSDEFFADPKGGKGKRSSNPTYLWSDYNKRSKNSVLPGFRTACASGQSLGLRDASPLLGGSAYPLAGRMLTGAPHPALLA